MWAELAAARGIGPEPGKRPGAGKYRDAVSCKNGHLPQAKVLAEIAGEFGAGKDLHSDVDGKGVGVEDEGVADRDQGQVVVLVEALVLGPSACNSTHTSLSPVYRSPLPAAGWVDAGTRACLYGPGCRRASSYCQPAT